MDILKFSNAGGFTTKTRYPDMLAGNTVWNPYSPTGSYDSLASVTVGSTAQSSITFSGIPPTYTHLQLRSFAGTNPASDPYVRFNGDGGTNYSSHLLYGTGSAASSYFNGASATSMPWLTGNSYGTANAFGASIVDIFDYANTNKYKTARALYAYDTNGAGQMNLSSGLWMSTSAINSIAFTANAGNFITNSSFALYGVKA